MTAVGEIKPAVVDDRAFRRARKLEDRGKQFLAVGRAVDVDTELLRLGGQIGEPQLVEAPQD